MLSKFVKCFRSSCMNNCDEPISDKLVEYSCIDQWNASPYDMPLLPADETAPDIVPVELPLEPAPPELRRQVPFVPSTSFTLNARFASRSPSAKISHCAFKRTPETSVAKKSSENGTSDFSTIAMRGRDRRGSHPGERDTRKYNTSMQGSATSAPVAAAGGESAMGLSDEQSANLCATTNVVFRRRRVIRKTIRPCTPFHLSKEYEVVKSGGVPNHVAFIMDGNRRFAKKNNVAKVEGHTKGFEKLAETLQWCLDLGIPEVTVYAFSIENFKRSTEEVNELMDLAREKFKRLLDEREKLKEHGVCVRVIGNLTLLPEDLRKLMSKTMIITKDNNKAFLNIAFAYTSRDEITSAIKSVVTAVEKKIISSEDISKHVINQCLYTNMSPNPALLIRTSGEIRLSDFLLWQTSSTCVYFSKVLWPEFSVWHMLAAVFHYQRNRQNIVRLKDFEESCGLENQRIDLFLKDVHAQRQMFIERAGQGVA